MQAGILRRQPVDIAAQHRHLIRQVEFPAMQFSLELLGVLDGDASLFHDQTNRIWEIFALVETSSGVRNVLENFGTACVALVRRFHATLCIAETDPQRVKLQQLLLRFVLGVPKTLLQLLDAVLELKSLKLDPCRLHVLLAAQSQRCPFDLGISFLDLELQLLKLEASLLLDVEDSSS